jgi:hypothetical protein
MFLGTVDLFDFDYDQMRLFSRRALQILVQQGVTLDVLTTTVHGGGYGLDVGEAAQSLVLGFSEGLMKHAAGKVRKICFVDRGESVVRLISAAIGELGVGHRFETIQPPRTDEKRSFTSGDRLAAENWADAKRRADAMQTPKEHVFVAMPFSEQFEDVYEFGIYNPVRSCGYICEKVDETSFTGDILQRIRQRIENAKLVIADLTEARPNVYLEVGYAWGRNVPVVFVARKGESLHFDVSTHRCLFYHSIRQLARDLETLLRGLGQTPPD